MNTPDQTMRLGSCGYLAGGAAAVLAFGLSFGACAAGSGAAAASPFVASVPSHERSAESALQTRFDASFASQRSILLAAEDKRGGMQSNAPADTPAADAAKPVAPDGPAGAAAKSSETKADPNFDVQQLFAGTCGWCHSNGGREAGKGPQLMDTKITDAEIIYRIKNGKTGYMPAFGSAYNDSQIKSIIAYIRNLKPAKP